MISKVLWVDVETTGVDPKCDDIIQIACLMEIAGIVCSEREWKIAPFEQTELSPEILRFHGVTAKDLRCLPSQAKTKDEFENWLILYVDKFNRNDKLVLAGYNSGFDYDFVRNWFERLGDKYFGSFFFWPRLDVAHELAKAMAYTSLRFSSGKTTLSDACSHFKINLKAHDALHDIRATRELYKILVESTHRSEIICDNGMPVSEDRT